MAKDYHRKESIKNYDAGVAKDRLISMACELEELGFKRDAKSLFRIVGELEAWQNK